MKLARLLVGALAALTFSAPVLAETSYVAETDPLVVQRLEQWQDWKFGLMMHWGAYSQWGVVESWSICSEDVDWCKRPDGVSYVEYVKRYEQLPTTFNPVRFDPDHWASVAKDAGMRYVVFTTKHHDGFAMFDTKQSNYKVTAQDVPFHTNPRANVAKAVFDAFRARGLGIGAYFSKPDWHSPDYWSPRWATPNRHTNYDTRKHPEMWKRFVDYTHAQVNELTSQYGPVDILWLDGGWVRPAGSSDGDQMVPWGEDIDMPGLARIARRNQPGLIIVDRAVGGQFEDYRTPEQQIPERPLPYPWETCMTLGDSWSFKPNDHYKPSRQVVQMLVDIVAKGGNLLLNVGPDGNGELPPEAVARLHDIGRWMHVNGEAIYGTRKLAPYVAGKLRFTKRPDGTIFAIYLPGPDETELPGTLRVPVSARVRKIQLLGSSSPLKWHVDGDSALVDIPASERKRTAGDYAWSFRLQAS